MLYSTFRKAKEAGACESSYKKMGKALGGIRKYGLDTPIPLDKVVEVCGIQDAIWALRCTVEPAEDLLIEFACRCAEHVLHFYEEAYPDDKRPRQAIEVARHCIKDKSRAARDAAWAASAVAWAARDAAWAASAAARAASAAARAASAAASAARDAAWAASSAAWAAWAAREAAWAASAAEIEWQTQTLLELLRC